MSAIVERYVSTGDPVGSKAVCEDLNSSFSSATIRSEMADLVNFGYLFQPHVSSGRVPSDLGYRLYINKLMNKKPLFSEEKNLINGVLSIAATDPESLLERAAQILSEVTGFTAVITTPPAGETRVRDIRFVKVGRRSAMIVLMTTGGMVKNKLFRCDFDLTEDILEMLGKILNEKFRGELLKSITPDYMNFLVGGNSETAFMLLPVLDVLMQASKEACEVEIKIYGRKNLLSIPDITTESVTDIFNFLENRNKVLRLLNSAGKNIDFIIGAENIYEELKSASVILTKYSVGEKSGIAAVIGPTRMDYAMVASQLEYVSALVGVLLGRILENN